MKIKGAVEIQRLFYSKKENKRLQNIKGYDIMDKKEGKTMDGIMRINLDEKTAKEYAYSEIVEAGGFVFLTFCVGNVGQSVEKQVHGALDNMEKRLALVGLNLSHVVKVDVMMKDPWNIPAMEKVFAERFGEYLPARKTIATEFAHKGGENGLQVQIDAIAYRGQETSIDTEA